MNWSSWTEFFAMGGYGLYVWGSYVVTFICILGEIFIISNRRRTLERQYGLTNGLNNKETKNETTS
ncbi:MAG: heme exporter protein CcmD [Nitrosomonas sp.]|nr:heme exporter protein CcmD [Nitrosomonas sp.]